MQPYSAAAEGVFSFLQDAFNDRQNSSLEDFNDVHDFMSTNKVLKILSTILIL